MKTQKPMDLHESLRPTIYFNWIVGMGVLHRPQSRLVYIMMILYSVAFWIFYIVAFVSINGIMSTYLSNNSPMAVLMYRVLVYTNTAVALVAPLLAWMRHKGLEHIVASIQKLDETYQSILGVEREQKKSLCDQIYQILTISFIILAITVTDGIWLQHNMSFFDNFSIMFTLHHPILLMLVTDFTFCGAVRCLEKKFQALNVALLSLAELEVASNRKSRHLFAAQNAAKVSSIREHETGEAKSTINKRYLFQTIRKIHLELSKLAGDVNYVYGIQNLISMALSSVMITGLLYTIYSAFYWKLTLRERIEEVTPPSCWCVIYVFKILKVTYSCAGASDEAQKSGQIIYDVLGSANDKEFQAEIQEFALQMIQNPVRFTACGFFTLDYTYVQGVIGSITTYLVILIQMSNASSSKPTPATNVTAT